MTATVRPTLLNGCARAATAAEARFRIQAPVPAQFRNARVIALDDGAAAVVRAVAAGRWGGARFYTGAVDTPDGLTLTPVAGADTGLADALAPADVVVLVATSDDGAGPAAVIGAACRVRGVMTAGLVVGFRSGPAVSALRPYARVLLVSSDEDDVTDILTALRA